MNNNFVSVCVALKPSLDRFVKGCRPIISLDGSFLKGKYKGCVLSAISLYGNNGLFSIGIYVYQREQYDSWSQFLKILEPHFRKYPLPLTLISDRAKGLVLAVEEVFPDSNHIFYFRHMYKNFKKEHKGKHFEHLSWGQLEHTKKKTMSMDEANVERYKISKTVVG